MKTANEMIDPTPGTTSLASRRIDAAASAWVVRRRAGLDPAGESEFAAWLAAEPAHAEALARLSAMADVLQRARITGATNDIVTQLKIRARKRRSRRQAVAAAGLAALLALAAYWRPDPDATPVRVAVAADAFEPIRRLPDGSLVELKPGAEVAIKYETDARRVELLRGEALFRVEKDAARPFVVRVSGVEVRAVGTAFNVRLAPAAITVLVTEGRVRVDDIAKGESLLPQLAVDEPPLLVAGQRMSVEVASSGAVLSLPQIAHVTADEIKETLSWRIPRLELDGVELEQAVAQMNRQNRLQILIDDNSIRNLRVSGVFLADDPETFVRLISKTFGLQVERRRSSEVVLRMK